MPRPRLRRRIGFRANTTFFKPQGIPIRNLEIISITAEEMEALRLKHVAGLNQTQCSEKMNTSQSTFQRILASAQEKVGAALVSGNAIEIRNS